MLQISEVEARYGGVRALKGISLQVLDGEVVTLLGANGAGKTTTMRTITGLMKPVRGTVEFGEERIDGLAPDLVLKKGISLVPEGRRIFQELTVLENLEMGAYARPDSDVQADLQKTFDMFPRLKGREKQLGGSLSGGEQQMLAIGRGLMARPKLLLLDEPSMGLAPIIVDQIFDLIVQLKEQRITILLVEQNANMALNVATRGYVLETGSIVLEGTAEELRASDLVQAAYLGG